MGCKCTKKCEEDKKIIFKTVKVFDHVTQKENQKFAYLDSRAEIDLVTNPLVASITAINFEKWNLTRGRR